MKFLTIAYLSGSAAAGLINPPTRVLERDLATVTGVLSAVSSNIVALDTAAKAFSGSSADLNSASAALIQSIKDGKAKVDASADLGLTEALGLQTPTTDLQTKGQALLDDLKAKKTQIQAAGICGTVLQQIKDINTNSQALSSSIVSKVPSAAQSIAKSLAAGLTDVLNSAQTEFGPANCVDSAPATSAAATSAAATSAAATSAAATSAAATSAAATSAAATSAAATSAAATSAAATSAVATSAAATSAAATSAAPPPVDACGAPPPAPTNASVEPPAPVEPSAPVATAAPVESSTPSSVSVPPGYCPCSAS